MEQGEFQDWNHESSFFQRWGILMLNGNLEMDMLEFMEVRADH